MSRENLEVATTLREVHSTNRHEWSAVCWLEGKTYHAPTCHLDVLDRVGGGDGFAAGFFYGLLPDCGTAPCVSSRHKTNAGDGVIVTQAPGGTGDPAYRP